MDQATGVISVLANSDLLRLLATLSEPDSERRRRVAHALGTRGGCPTASVFLQTALMDRDWRVRSEAALALARLRSSSARGALARVANTDEVDYVREAAKSALARIEAAA